MIKFKEIFDKQLIDWLKRDGLGKRIGDIARYKDEYDYTLRSVKKVNPTISMKRLDVIFKRFPFDPMDILKAYLVLVKRNNGKIVSECKLYKLCTRHMKIPIYRTLEFSARYFDIDDIL